MKKAIKIILCISVICLGACFFTGCGDTRPLPKDIPTAMVIIEGKHNNSKKIEVFLHDEIKEIYSSFGNACIIVADGDPSILHKDGNMVGAYDPQYIENSKNDYQYKAIWEREYLNPQIALLTEAIANCTPDDDEVDTLKALQLAAEALEQMESWMGENVNKKIIICDTGLSTSGEVNFLNTDCNTLLKGNEQIAMENIKGKKFEQLLSYLDNKKNIPDLSGVTIRWYGLGKVDKPQPELNNVTISNLQYIWGKILSKAGAIPDQVGGIDKEFGYFVATIANESENFDKSVTPIIFWDGKGIEISNNEIEFEKRTDEVKDKKKAIEVLQPYVDNLKNYPDMRLLLVGTTARVKEGSEELSKKRAEKVREMLIELGISPDRIEVKGLGANASWHEEEWINGEFVESIAEKNRAVFIFSRDSEQAKEIMNEN